MNKRSEIVKYDNMVPPYQCIHDLMIHVLLEISIVFHVLAVVYGRQVYQKDWRASGWRMGEMGTLGKVLQELWERNTLQKKKV